MSRQAAQRARAARTAGSHVASGAPCDAVDYEGLPLFPKWSSSSHFWRLNARWGRALGMLRSSRGVGLAGRRGLDLSVHQSQPSQLYATALPPPSAQWNSSKTHLAVAGLGLESPQ